MERAILQEHLSAAKRHAERGEIHVRSQQRVVEDLESQGQDTGQARHLLKVFEETQASHLDHIDWLLDQLAKLH